MSTFEPAINPVRSAPPRIVSLTTTAAPRVVSVSPWALAWRRFQRNQLALMGVVVVLFFGGLALGADAIAPYNYLHFDFSAYALLPTRAHFLGTDFEGRDLFTLMMYGGRISMAVGIVVPLLIVVIGVTVGLLAGYAGGIVDTLLMRVSDVMFAFPSLLFLVLAVSTFGRSLGVIFIALGLSGWPGMARIVRAQVLQIKQSEYVMGARAVGVRPLGVVVGHILPNIMGAIVVTATLSIPNAIMSEAALTYLNIGLDSATPSWGMMINMAQSSLFWHPLLVLYPALAVTALTLAFTFIGDGLRDALDVRLGMTL